MHAISLIDVWIGEEFSQVYIGYRLVTTLEYGGTGFTFQVIVVRKVADISTIMLIMAYLVLLEPLLALLLQVSLHCVVICRFFLLL